MVTYLVVALIIAVVGFIAFKFTQGKGKKPGNIIQKGKTVYIMGECGSGKTALLYKLANKQSIDSISSIEENETKIEVDGNEVPVIDIPGHNYSKQKYIKELKYARVIVMVVDSSNQETFPRTAEYVYDILIQKDFQSRDIPILIALNKQDSPKALKLADFEHLFNKEMERIKRSKRAVSDESEEIEDFLKHQDTPFSMSENNIKSLECSVQRDEIKNIQEFLDNNY